MKKVLAMVLAVFMLVSVLCTGTVATVSADEAAAAIVVDSASAYAGSTVSVAVRLQNNPGIVGLRVAVGYDASVLTPTAMVAQDLAASATTFGPLTANPLSIMWMDAINPNMTDDCAVALLTFQVAEDAAVGTYPLTLSFADPADIFNENLEVVPFATVDGAITVEEKPEEPAINYGDVNDDGKINMRDLGQLQQYLNKWEVANFNAAAADVRLDGKVNMQDLGRLQQYLNKWDVVLGDGTVPTPPPVEPDPEPPVEDDVLTVEEAIAMGSAMEHNVYTETKYYVTGVITEVYNTMYGNMKITDDAGNILTIYGTFSADGSTRYDAMEVKPVAGDTVTIYGIVGQYNGTPQIKNGWITEHTVSDKPVDPDPDVPVDPPVEDGVVENIEAGVAYKLGLYQAQKGATYYFTGAMSGFYGATETDVALAVDMYVEIVDGGYKLYFNDATGAKKYICLTQSGTHYNFTFGADASVFTLDAEKNALCAVAGDQLCYMGTYGSYVTIGTLTESKISDSDYIARLYTVGSGSTPDVPVDPEPDVPVDPPVEGGAIIDFTDKANRVSYSSEEQVWAQNGITVTNNKAASTTNVGDYGGEGYPARFYKGSSLLVEYKGMTKVVFNVDDYKDTYVTDLVTSITTGTVSADGTVVTVTFDAPVDSLFIAELVAQVRVDSIIAYGEGGDIGGGDVGGDDPVDPPVDPDPDVPGDEPSVGGGTLEFTDKANRVSYSTEEQVWAQNGITVTNNKGASTSNVGDYGGDGYAARFYKSSNLLVEYKGMTEIVFNCDSYKASYATDLAASITTGTVSVDGTVVTVTFASPVDSLFIETLAAQVRVLSISVKGEGGDIGGGDVGGDEPVDPPVDPEPDEPGDEPSVGGGTLEFTDKANRVSYSTEEQVWAQNGITVTNNKGASTSNVGDYGGDGYAARFYKGSNLLVECKGMTEIVFNCDSYKASYATDLVTSITDGTVSADGTVVTVTFASPVDSLYIAELVAQVRVLSISVNGGGSSEGGDVGGDTPATPDAEELSIADAIQVGLSQAHNVFTEQKYYVTGVITEVYNDMYGNMRLIDDAGNILTIYGTFGADGTTRYDALEVKPVDGDTVTVYGVIGQYNGTPQMKNGWITAHTVGDAPVEPAPELSVEDAPVAGVAYKFGMIQGNVSADTVYYLAGGMSGYYMATVSSSASAIDVYLEETSGGFYMYTLVDGAKTYINMVVSGTHVNGAYEATASTIYTFDTDSYTLIADIDGVPYWFGTRSDMNYTTVGPCAVEYAGFYCQLYV